MAATAGGKGRKPKPEGFKIYVRAPEDASVEEVTRFLKDFAKLLSDDKKNIKVEPYEGFYGVDPKKAVSAAGSGRAGTAKASAKAVAKKTAKKPAKKTAAGTGVVHPVGGPKSPLVPMYVCHNKN